MENTRESVGVRVAIGTLSNYVGKILAAAIAFFLTPFVLHNLGTTQFSIWALVISIVSYGSLLDFGIGAAVVKYVAEHRARQEWHDARAVLATALCLYLGLAAAGILLSLGVAWVVTPRLPLSPANAGLAWWLVVLLGSSTALSLPCSLANAALRGANRFEMSNLLSSAGAVAGAVATVVTILARGQVRALAVSNIAVMLLMQPPGFWLLWRVNPELRFRWQDARVRVARRMSSFSVWVLTGSFADLFHSRAGEIVIGSFLPVNSLAPYALAKRLAETAQSLAGQFAKVLPPLTAELNAVGERRRMRVVWLASSRLTIAMFAPMGCALSVFAVPLLRAWAGPQYVAGAPVLMILAAAFLCEIALWPAAAVLQAQERYRPVAIASVCSGLAILGLSIWLVPRIGVVGAAVAILLGTAGECLFFVLPLTMGVLGVGLRDVLFVVMAPVAVPCAAMTVVLLAIRKWLSPQTMTMLGLAVAAGCLVFAAIYLLSSQTATERWGIARLAQAIKASANS